MSDDQSELQAPLNIGGAWWALPEACIWIATRDSRYVEEASERVRHSLFLAESLVSEESEMLTGPPLWLTVSEVRRLLVTAAGRGIVQISGRLRGQSSQLAIEPIAWANLELTEDHGNVIARPPGYDPFADWWDTLRVSADAIRKQWPWAEHPASLLHGGDGLPDCAETTLADAWRWCLFKAATLEENGPSRIVWKDLGNWVERRLFDAFTVGDLECRARLDPERHVWSIVPPDWFRLAVELHPADNKLRPHSKADMADFGPAWEIVRLASDFLVNVEAVRSWWAKVAAATQPSSRPIRQPTPATVATPATDGTAKRQEIDSRGAGLYQHIREWKIAAYPNGTSKPQKQLAAECAKALGRSVDTRTYRRAFGGK